MMTNRRLKGLLLLISLALVSLAPGVSRAEPVDFTTFLVDSYPQTNGPLALWLTTPNEARIDDAPVAEGGSPNASVNVFYGPDNVLDKRIVGTLTPGSDDDPIGFVLGYQPGDADYFNIPDVLEADYLLIDWKGATQTFNFADTAGTGIFFHDQTLGGEMPVGLALSRVSGIPTADELWQHVDSLDNPDGGVEQLARGATLGSTAYPRDGSSVTFDIRYSESNVTVLVDGVEQFNVDGTFPDGRFGLYSLNQGPSAIWSDFEIFDLTDPLTATIDRATGEVEISNTTGADVGFQGYTIASGLGGLDPDTWTSITGNYDSGGAGSVDSDPWTITSSTIFDLSEEEEAGGSDGATLSAGQSLNLGAAWVPSMFEDVLVDLVAVNGDLIPVNVEYINGPDGGPLARSDLNADGVIDAADWPLFYENTLTDLSSLSPVQQYLHGDLDGDGDNDVNDFAIFKSDFDAANGAGAFAVMVSGVPEPAGIILLLVGAAAVLVFRKRLPACGGAGVVALALLAVQPQAIFAAPLDFTTFTVESYPQANGFPLGEWDTTATTATISQAANNAGANVFYGTESALNTRITGTVTNGFFDDLDMLVNGDDDMFGFALGYNPGDADYFNPASLDADYLLIDWKGVTQNFNWADDPTSGVILHELTPATTAPAGLALSRVTGMPTADELWSHADLEENPDGGLEQLVRGATLGSTSYPRNATPSVFDIRYTPTRITVAVDGAIQFDVMGDFPDGRFGLYTQGQGPPPVFSDFEMTPLDEVTDVLRAVVHRDTGEIELTNESMAPIDFDYYELSSTTQSLNVTGWNSLSDQDFQAIGGEEGQSWAEAGGSSSAALAELFLQASSSLEAGSSVSLGNAYSSQINGEDLLLTYRAPDGSFGLGVVEYVGMPGMGGIPGDYNNNGQVEQADLDLVLLNWGQSFDTLPDDWMNERPTEGIIDQTELDGVLLNWGSGAGALGSAGAVPEPSSLVLIGLAGVSLVALRLRRKDR